MTNTNTNTNTSVKFHIFQNPGAIDLGFLSLFGASVKLTEDAIGEHGTGLKYAIAVIMREGGKISIQSKEDDMLTDVTFDKQERKLRGVAVQVCIANICKPSGSQQLTLPFTVDNFGLKWEPWMAFRELYSNMKDERGKYFCVSEEDDIPYTPVPLGDWTRVIVQLPMFDEMGANLGKYFLSERADSPLYANTLTSAFKPFPGTTGNLYMKGVLVSENANTIFDYNYNGSDMKSLLSEERKITDKQRYATFVSGVLANKHVEMVDHLLNASDEKSENSYWMPDLVIEQMYKRFKQNPRRELHGTFATQITAKAAKDMQAHEQNITDPKHLATLFKAQDIVGSMGFKYPEGVQYKLIRKDNPMFLAAWDQETRTCYLNESTLNEGVRRTCMALLEEYTHIEGDCSDGSTRQQHFYLDMIMKVYNRFAAEPV